MTKVMAAEKTPKEKIGWLLPTPLIAEFRGVAGEHVNPKAHWLVASAAILMLLEMPPAALAEYIKAVQAAEGYGGDYERLLRDARMRTIRRRAFEASDAALAEPEAMTKVKPSDIDPHAAKTFQTDTMDDDGSTLNPPPGNGKRPRRDKPRPKGSRRGR